MRLHKYYVSYKKNRDGDLGIFPHSKNQKRHKLDRSYNDGVVGSGLEISHFIFLINFLDCPTHRKIIHTNISCYTF